MNYNQFSKKEIIQKIINVKPSLEACRSELSKHLKKELLEMLDVLLEEKAMEVLDD